MRPIAALALLATVGCADGWMDANPPPAPDAPARLEGSYRAYGVDLRWELGPRWNGEVFRVYAKRAEDQAYRLAAETTSCLNGECRYRDVNVLAGQAYDYYVAARDPETELETESENVVRVVVPEPPDLEAPAGLAAVGLDGMAYLTWSEVPASEGETLLYRVFKLTETARYILGETDSPGFLDLRARNGETIEYAVSAVDEWEHESDLSDAARTTPRPDYFGEIVYVFEDDPDRAGFRFQSSGDSKAIVSGEDQGRHFALEADEEGVRWLVPGPDAEVHSEPRWTTALRCGPGADEDCVDWSVAPSSGYARTAISADPGYTYVFRVRDSGEESTYGAARVSFLGEDSEARRVMVFDWAYQTKPGDRNLRVRVNP